MQKSNLVWLAKGKPEDMPPNLQDLGLTPVVVDFQTFEEAMSELLDPANFDFQRLSVKKRRNEVRALNDAFMEAAFEQLTYLPGNERMFEAASAIQDLVKEGLR